MNKFSSISIVVTLLFAAPVLAQHDSRLSNLAKESTDPGRPNILWLSAEDIGPQLGCYGDQVAKTPNLNALAAKGMAYDVAWSNYPVCAPARTTIITGVYASSMAAGHMRCDLQLDKDLKMFPQYLREAGYYCTNKSKEDYNLQKPGQVWDQSNGKAHYRNRGNGQPFFAVFNHTGTHESKIRKRPHELQTDPTSIVVPPYYPDIPEVRRDWAQYYDNIAAMDNWVGQQLNQLGKSGQAENTIVVFFGDHGSGMPRHKRYAGDSGMRVPLIVYVPEKFRRLAPKEYAPGSHSKRLVGFVDFASTMLSLAGIQPPAEMQGKAFMGPHETVAPQYVYGFRSRMDEKVDCSRSVRDGRYVYIRNYMPHLPHGQFISYQQQTPTTAIWNRMYNEGKLNKVQAYFWGPRDPEELYDLQTDPHETINLAKGLEEDLAEDSRKLLCRFRDALDTHQSSADVEMLPEPITSRYEAKSSGFDLQSNTKLSLVVLAAKQAADTTSENRLPTHKFIDLVADKGQHQDVEQAIRHWASVGLLIRGAEAVANHKDELYKSLNDRIPTIRVNIAETLATYGDDDDLKKALDVLLEAADMTNTDFYSAIWALNAIDRLGEKAKPILARVAALPRKPENMKRGNEYVERLILNLINQ